MSCSRENLALQHSILVRIFLGHPVCSGMLMQSRRGRNEKQYVASMLRYVQHSKNSRDAPILANHQHPQEYFTLPCDNILRGQPWEQVCLCLPLDRFLANIIIIFIRWLLLRCDVLTMGDVPMLLRRWLTSAANMLIKVSNYPNETSRKLSKL